MESMDQSGFGDDSILLRIQNSAKADQIVQLVYNKSSNSLETQGLATLFKVKEIRLESMEALTELSEYAEVLSFLVESMSRAMDYNLPFYYHSDFEYQGKKYNLRDDNDHKVLKRVA